MTATAANVGHYMPRITEGNYTATVYNLIKDEKYEQVGLSRHTASRVGPPATRATMAGCEDSVE
jgi:hypothetical protein